MGTLDGCSACRYKTYFVGLLPGGFCRLLASMIRGARQRARFDVAETQSHADLAPARDLFRRHVALDGQTALKGLQILPDGHDVARDRAQVLHQLNDLIEAFAQSNHDAALGQHPARLAVAPVACTFEKLKRLPVISVGAHALVETRDRLRIVIKDIWLGVEHSIERRFVTVKIRDQNFDLAFGTERAYLANRLGPVGCAAVRQIVAINGGDDG